MLCPKKIESVQCRVASEITGIIKCTSRQKLCQELALEYLNQRRWITRLCLFCKISLTKMMLHVYNLVPPMRNSSRHPNTFNIISYRTDYFKKKKKKKSLFL